LLCAARTTWGLKPFALRKLQKAAIESTILWLLALNKKKIVKKLVSVLRISTVLISKAFLSTKTETITVLAGCLPIDFRAKEMALSRYLKSGRRDYWPLLNNSSHKLNGHTYYTESQANYVFGNSLSHSNSIDKIRKTLRINLYMKWYEIFCQAVKPWTL